MTRPPSSRSLTLLRPSLACAGTRWLTRMSATSVSTRIRASCTAWWSPTQESKWVRISRWIEMFRSSRRATREVSIFCPALPTLRQPQTNSCTREGSKDARVRPVHKHYESGLALNRSKSKLLLARSKVITANRNRGEKQDLGAAKPLAVVPNSGAY